MRFLHVFYLGSLILSTGVYSQSNPNYVDQPILMGTFQIKFKEGSATCFQYKGKDSVGYLITAKHVFATKYKRTIRNADKPIYKYYDSVPYRSGEAIEISLFYDGSWAKLIVRLYFDEQPEDVAVLKTELDMEGNNFNFGSETLKVSQDCFFVGFPLGLRMDYSKMNTFGKFPLPFVRKGIISGFVVSDRGFPTGFYIDGHNTYGFSGGPLIFFNYEKNKFYVAGVVSSYIPQQNHYYNSDGTVENSKENSGIMEVTDIEFANKILRRIGAM